MAKNLVIVESPAKAKTIEGYLGKDFMVKSSYGHIRDLPKGSNSVDVEAGFVPQYVVPEDKKALVRELKKWAKEAEVVWLATDEDREGEAISWHLAETLGLPLDKTRRIVFSEITKPAILRAIESPRTVDLDLVNAQQARRVLDRLVGFDLSPVLWRKVRRGLSAGRVQSVTVRIVVDREREIEGFQSEATFRVVGIFVSNGTAFRAELSERFSALRDAEAFVTDCVSAIHQVRSVEMKPATRKPAAPFTTSTLQQEASRKLGFPVAKTMRVAQKLYEAGHITYMRTDSTNLSETALDGAAAAIEQRYGTAYAQRRTFSKSAKGAQEAHEAIRPTDFTAMAIDGERDDVRLYELIWKRSIASQMADARLENTTAIIDISTRPEHFSAKGQVVAFDGFLKVYAESTDEDATEEKDGEGESGKSLLPAMVVGQTLERKNLTATERFSKHPPRYTEASLVKRLEELGIGRPSTYAPTISTVQKREYVVKKDLDGTERKYRVVELQDGTVRTRVESENTGAERAKLFPTDIGRVVNNFLVANFPDIVDFHFTARVEEEFDVIAQGAMDWRQMLRNFYAPFKGSVERFNRPTGATAVVDAPQEPEPTEGIGDRFLGEDPTTGKPVIARLGRYGALAQIGARDDEEKRFAPLLKTQSIETITLEQALELFKLPRQLGEWEGKVVTAAIGRFGPYLRYDGGFYSIKAADGDDPHSIAFERAVEVIQAKKDADAQALIRVFDEDPEVKVLNGRYGPYIKAGKLNATIPKKEDPAGITWERAQELIEEAKKRPAKGRKRSS